MAWCQTLASSTALKDRGGKGRGLHKLVAAGFPVPEGFVVTSDAFARCTAPLRAALDDLYAGAADGGNIDTTAQQARALISAVHIDDDVRAAIADMLSRVPHGLLIVRSSANGEDGATSSFAGQLDSVLDVAHDIDAVMDAVRACWASSWTARALHYQLAHGGRLGGVAVVVQRQVEAAFAGVLFTEGPSDSGCQRVEWVCDRGARLVNGELDPAWATLPRDATQHAGAPVSFALSDDVQAMPPRAAMMALADMGMRVESVFGCPQDIEWVIDNDDVVWLVQARPITTTPQAPLRSPQRFSNANVNENYPEPITPMLYSVAKASYAAYFATLGKELGVSHDRIDDVRDALNAIVGAHCARLYYNLTNLHACLRAAPFGDALLSSFNLFVGVDSGAAEGTRSRPSRAKDIVDAARMMAVTTTSIATLERRLRAFEATVDAFAARAQNVRALDECALEQLVREFLRIRLTSWAPAALSDASAMMSYGALSALLSRVVPPTAGQGSSLQNDLLKGLGDTVSSLPAQALWRLSRLQRRANETKAASDRSAFDAARARFVTDWGFRRSGELMLTVPTYQEDDQALDDLITRFANIDGDSPEQLTAQQARARTDREAALMRSLPPPTRLALRALLRLTHNAIGCRERARLKQALLYTRLRAVLLALGDRLAARGVINERDDIFMLEHQELLSLLDGSAMFASSVKDLIHLRKTAHQQLTERTPPDAFVVERGAPAPANVSGAAEGEADLNGVAASGGVVRGRAAVLVHVDESERFVRGDVLVTRQTDPGWGHVLFLASGLVIERGGMLSHGAIVAREFGVPCVTGVKHATRHIVEGSTIIVDGSRGTVVIEKAA